MFLAILVFVVGMGSLGAEIAAVRLLSPYFGASTVVWANTIGIVLVALSVGYWLGGRAADRRPDRRLLCLVALAASILLAAVPFVSRPLLDLAVSALDSISAGAFLGSLVGVLLLVAIPVLLLGMVSPWALRLAMDDVERAGAIAGRLYALSTAGSLLGTLTSALLFIPALGTRRTFLVFALLIAAVAVIGLLPAKRYAVVPAALIALLALPVGTLKASANGRVIHEAETPYQYARVIEDAEGTRRLELNEGHAVHSVYRRGTVLTGDYWDRMRELAGRPRSVAILGNAAGSTARAYATLMPTTRVDAVEIDPELTRIGRRYFALPDSVNVYDEDARPFLRRMDKRRWDAILIDAYRQPYIPFYLVTREFFDLARSRLNPGGVVVINVGHPEGHHELERALAATMRAAFKTVQRDESEPTNTQLVATDGRPRPGLEPALGGGEVYTDDKAPVEWLVDQSLLEYAAEGG